MLLDSNKIILFSLNDRWWQTPRGHADKTEGVISHTAFQSNKTNKAHKGLRVPMQISNRNMFLYELFTQPLLNTLTLVVTAVIIIITHMPASTSKHNSRSGQRLPFAVSWWCAPAATALIVMFYTSNRRQTL